MVVSDCMQHDTAAFHLLQKSFIAFLKTILPSFPEKYTTFLMEQLLSTKTANFLSTCAIMKLILESMPNDTSLQLRMGRVPVVVQ